MDATLTQTRRAAYSILLMVGLLGSAAYLIFFGDEWIAINLLGFVFTYGLYQYYFSVHYGLRKVVEYARTEVSCDAVIILTTPVVLLGHRFLLVPFFLGYLIFIAQSEIRTRKVQAASSEQTPVEVETDSRQVWGYAIISTVGTAASMAGLQLSIVVARQAIGVEQAGLYAAAFALMAPMLYLPRTLATALLPRAAADIALGRSEVIQASLAKLTKFLAMVALPLTLLGAVLAPQLLEIISGHAYVGAAEALRLLFIASFFLVVSIPAVNVLSAKDLKDLAIPFYSSVVGLIAGSAVWVVGLSQGHGIDYIALGVLVGSIVKTIPPVFIAHWRYRITPQVWMISTIILAIGGILAAGDPRSRLIAAGLGLICGAVSTVYVWRLVTSTSTVSDGKLVSLPSFSRVSSGRRPSVMQVEQCDNSGQLPYRRLSVRPAGVAVVRLYRPEILLMLAFMVSVCALGVGYLASHAQAIAGWELIMFAALLLAVWFTRELGFDHPLIWFTILFTLYFLLGAQNWIEAIGNVTSFRTHLETNTVLRIPVFGLAAFAAGAMAVAGAKRRVEVPMDRASRLARIRSAGHILFLIGILGVAYTVHKSGILLIHANARAKSSGAADLASVCLVPAGLLLASTETRRRMQVLWIALCVFGVMLLAYRTPVLLLIGSFIVYQVGLGAIRYRVVILVGVALAAFALTVYDVRLEQSSQVIYGGHVVSTGPLRYVPALTPLYYGFAHEGTSVFSRVEHIIPTETSYYNGAVQLQALVTLIPTGGGETSTGRRRLGARDLVTELVYGTNSSATSLTPTIVGGPYMDFGVIGVIVEMALLGSLMGWLYNGAKRAKHGMIDRLVYAYAATLVALSIHSGLLDGILDVALPLVAFAVYTIAGLLRAQSTAQCVE
jgi:oligosaccharide repeat unit polymerase